MTPQRSYTTEEARKLSGMPKRQVDYLVAKGFVVPSIDPGVGTGKRRKWSLYDVAWLKRVRERVEWGMTLEAALREFEQDPPMALTNPSHIGTLFRADDYWERYVHGLVN